MGALQWLYVHIDPFERYTARRSPAIVKGPIHRGSVSYPASMPLSQEGTDHPPPLDVPPWGDEVMDLEDADEIESTFFRTYRSMLLHHAVLLEGKAEELIARGLTTIATDHGVLAARLIRFWNGSGAIDLRSEGGSSISRISRRELRNSVGLIVDNLAMALAQDGAVPIAD